MSTDLVKKRPLLVQGTDSPYPNLRIGIPAKAVRKLGIRSTAKFWVYMNVERRMIVYALIRPGGASK